MRLSKLHINGFKSFPDRAELGFDTGVTAIVGPNGCGKSNVVDAITWVLGEQSAKSLRGERMEDVIFNGSDARKPTATAEVRLKLTDVAQAAMAAATAATPGEVAEFLDDLPLVTRDVEIGRRLYRSGESEYLIDGEVCRLRDVHDLLMDSGLGVKAYAVIEQGKIGQILSSRPAERRALIEEAAGVTKYKARRRTGGTQARSGPAEPDARGRHHLRGGEAARRVEAAGGARAAVPAAARGTAPVGAGAVRAQARGADPGHRGRRRAGSPTPACSEAAAAARVAELEAELETLRLGLTAGRIGRHGDARRDARARARVRAPPAAD